MSEQEQGAIGDASAQPRFQAHPPPASADPAEPDVAGDRVVGDAAPEPAPGDGSDTGGDVGGADQALEGGDAAPAGEPEPEPDAADPDPDSAEPVAADPAVGAEPTPDDQAAAEPPAADQAAPTMPPEGPAVEPFQGFAQALALDLAAHRAAIDDKLAQLTASVAEANRLRARDQAHVDELHADNTRLRRGELTAAMAPLLNGLVRLADQMASMAAGDKNSIAGMLRVQLLQTLDVAADVTEFSPADGEPFDPKRMTGAGREDTTDPDQDGTVCRTVRSGFARGDGSIVRVAEVIVRRLAPTPRPAAAGSEQ